MKNGLVKSRPILLKKIPAALYKAEIACLPWKALLGKKKKKTQREKHIRFENSRCEMLKLYCLFTQ